MSPVVGVMLMLVVTIIIAAVVSAFAGGLSKSTDKGPSATFEVHIANDGTWGGSYFDISTKAVSDAISTKDLKIMTSWKAVNGTRGGATVTGPNLTGGNTHYGSYTYNSPLGFGPGVNQSAFTGSYYPDQMFGNYSLMAGTRMHNSAAGFSTSTGGYGVSVSSRYQYTAGSYHLESGNDGVDAMESLLGMNWYVLRPGDTVTVQVVHIPSGRLLYDDKVTVEG
ncbi:type IV pilin N-terminal domain-containing protein [Methanoregula sp. UBA64]|uniref:type IV pilin N-terminal domain-containing protein n=1 Tax=Methanoregula sp. UBA64 TaxID=1915554 RepID=UPI0025D86ED6|nr:type IV pilin N-terminal domain-containing protein [Methanoregula sp. UBA64]